MEKTPISPCSVRRAAQSLISQAALAVVAPNSMHRDRQGMELKNSRETLTINARANVGYPGNNGKRGGDFIMIPERNAKRRSHLERKRATLTHIRRTIRADAKANVKYPNICVACEITSTRVARHLTKAVIIQA